MHSLSYMYMCMSFCAYMYMYISSLIMIGFSDPEIELHIMYMPFSNTVPSECLRKLHVSYSIVVVITNVTIRLACHQILKYHIAVFRFHCSSVIIIVNFQTICLMLLLRME